MDVDISKASLGLAKNDAKAAKYETDMGKPIGDFSLVQLYLDTSSQHPFPSFFLVSLQPAPIYSSLIPSRNNFMGAIAQ